MWVMHMYEVWNNIIINKISLAVEVKPGEGKFLHIDRPFHGLVLTDSDMVINYHFSDGRVMHVDENTLFYFPKGSSYRCEGIKRGYCYAINFDSDIECDFFTVTFRNSENIQRVFKDAISAWNKGDGFSDIYVKKCLYEIILMFLKETSKSYLPKRKELRIEKAEEFIKNNLFSDELKISYLAEKCKMSETYFRRIFEDKYGISPKKYIIQLKMNHAKKLLLNSEYSVEEVCVRCGYSDVSLFSREFKKIAGVSPSGFKNSV